MIDDKIIAIYYLSYVFFILIDRNLNNFLIILSIIKVFCLFKVENHITFIYLN